MEKFKFPSPYKHETVCNFFSDFISLNQKSDSFSHRHIADKLGWPTSYISDLVKGRKNLTCLRSIEFSSFANYSPLETERLLFIGIHTGLPISKQNNIFSEKILGKITKNRIQNNDQLDLIYDPKTLFVFEIIKWCKKYISPENISKLLKTFKIKTSDVELVLKKLDDRNVIEYEPQKKLKIKQPILWADECGDSAMGIEVHKHFAESFIQFCDDPQGPALFNSVLLELPKEKFPELADQIIALRNWFQNLAIETFNSKINNTDDTFVFQLDLNLFPIIDKDAITVLQQEKTL